MSTARLKDLGDTTKRYRAALIGLGNVAFRFDRDLPGCVLPLTQGGAFLAHPAVNLVGGVSPDAEDRAAFEQALRLPTFADPEQMLIALAPEIVGICSPTERHHDHACLCLASGTAMIWLEKPACATLSELDDLSRKVTPENITRILVNYMRRYEPAHLRLRNLILAGCLGDIVSIQLSYSRGLLNNGSHMIDQAFHLMGDMGEGEMLATPIRLDDQHSWFSFRIGSVPVSVVGTQLPFHCNDIMVTGTCGRASITHGGMDLRLERPVEHELYPGFFRLIDTQAVDFGPPEPGRAMTNALDDLLGAHQLGRDPASNLSTAKRTQRIVEEALAAGTGRDLCAVASPDGTNQQDKVTIP